MLMMVVFVEPLCLFVLNDEARVGKRRSSERADASFMHGKMGGGGGGDRDDGRAPQEKRA